MNALRNLQQGVIAALDCDVEAMPVMRGRTAATGFAVYRNNFIEGTIKALAADYPVIQRLVGTACFRSLARDYRRQYPSRSGDLQEFGTSLPDILDARFGATAYSWLGDVARLERAIAECLCERVLPGCDVSALANPDDSTWRDLRLHFQPASRWLRSAWPVLAIWQANQGERDGSGTTLDAGGVHLVVMRQGEHVLLRELEASEHALATALAAGLTLEKALVGARANSRPSDIGALLARLIAWGLVHEVEFLSDQPREGDSHP